jgi:hypothetical protein
MTQRLERMECRRGRPLHETVDALETGGGDSPVTPRRRRICVWVPRWLATREHPVAGLKVERLHAPFSDHSELDRHPLVRAGTVTEVASADVDLRGRDTRPVKHERLVPYFNVDCRPVVINSNPTP